MRCGQAFSHETLTCLGQGQCPALNKHCLDSLSGCWEGQGWVVIVSFPDCKVEINIIQWKQTRYFQPQKIFLSKCQNYGQVSLSSVPDPSKCSATGRGVEAAVVGETSTAIFHALNFKSQPCKESVTSLNCDLMFEKLIHEQSRVQHSTKRTKSIRDQLPAHHQGEAPAPHQSGGPAHQGKSLQHSSDITSQNKYPQPN